MSADVVEEAVARARLGRSVAGMTDENRKIIKTRGSFPDEDSARELLYLAITRAQQKWTHTYNWNTALTAFRIHFGPAYPTLPDRHREFTVTH